MIFMFCSVLPLMIFPVLVLRKLSESSLFLLKISRILPCEKISDRSLPHGICFLLLLIPSLIAQHRWCMMYLGRFILLNEPVCDQHWVGQTLLPSEESIMLRISEASCGCCLYSSAWLLNLLLEPPMYCLTSSDAFL